MAQSTRLMNRTPLMRQMSERSLLQGTFEIHAEAMSVAARVQYGGLSSEVPPDCTCLQCAADS